MLSVEIIDIEIQTPIQPSVRLRRTNSVRILTISNKPNYNKVAHLDARSYSETLNEENELDKILKEYLRGNQGWYELIQAIAKRENNLKAKKPRIRKGPWMKNRRENCNTRKSRIYQFTQNAYKQNRKATINKILTLYNSEQMFLDIADVEKVYGKCLEQGNQVDMIDIQYPEENHSEIYGKFLEEEME